MRNQLLTFGVFEGAAYLQNKALSRASRPQRGEESQRKSLKYGEKAALTSTAHAVGRRYFRFGAPAREVR